MSAHTGSRLWPVMTVLVGLLALAVTLEVFARTRDSQAIVVQVRAAETSSFGSDDDDTGGNEPEADATAPIDDAHAKARELGRRGDTEAAIGALRTQLQSQPDVAVLHSDLGYYLLVAGHDSEALHELERARELGSNSPVAFLNLGVALRHAGDLTAASQALEHALALRPSFRAAKLALATVWCAQKKWAPAMAMLDELVKTGGNAARAAALLAQGRAYLSQDKAAKADAAFDKAIEWMPAQAEVRVAAARAYLNAGGAANVAKARSVAEMAVQLAPDIAMGHGVLGRALEAAGETDAAETSYQVALKLDPDFHYARRRLLRIALGRQNFQAAQSHAERLLALAPTAPEHHFLAGLVAAYASKPDEARAHYASAIAASHNGYPEAYFNLGLLEKELGRNAEAIAAYKQAIEHKPDYLSAWNNLGLVYASSSHEADAEAAYRKALAIDVRYWQAWANLGKLALRQKNYAQAISSFERAVAIRPSAQEPLLNLGVAYRRAGRNDDAVKTYRTLVAQKPRYVSAWFNLGVALRHAGQVRQAREAYEHAILLDDTHGPSQRNLAELLVQTGELAAAREKYESILDQEPGDRSSRVALADVLRRQGDADGCARVVRAATAGRDAQTQLLVERCASRAEAQRLSL